MCNAKVTDEDGFLAIMKELDQSCVQKNCVPLHPDTGALLHEERGLVYEVRLSTPHLNTVPSILGEDSVITQTLKLFQLSWCSGTTEIQEFSKLQPKQLGFSVSTSLVRIFPSCPTSYRLTSTARNSTSHARSGWSLARRHLILSSNASLSTRIWPSAVTIPLPQSRCLPTSQLAIPP